MKQKYYKAAFLRSSSTYDKSEIVREKKKYVYMIFVVVLPCTFMDPGFPEAADK